MKQDIPVVHGTVPVTTSQPVTAVPVGNLGIIPVAPVTQIYPEFHEIKSLPVPQEFASIISPGG